MIKLNTERLIVYTASRDEMQKIIDDQTDDILKTAYREMLQGASDHPDQWEWYAIWIIERKDGSKVGDLCFKGLNNDGSTEIGYGISTEYQGRGYATEAVDAAVSWALRQSEVRRVEAETEPDNKASQRVLEKCGFIPAGTTGEEGPRFVKTLWTPWPDYENCIAGLPNSIMQYFGVTPAGSTLPLLDRYLDKRYKNVVVILLDGMGVNILEENLSSDGFFRTHLAGSISSVFPPTTVAATTSVQSGLPPCEHAWLGWDCYYPQVDKNVTVFTNREQGTNAPAADYNVPQRYTGYESIFDRFEKAGRKAYAVTPFHAPHPDSFRKICKQIARLCRQDGEKYVYAYWNEPDHTMHGTGVFSKASRRLIGGLQKQVEKLCRKLKDTLVIVTADHGHIDSEGVCITDYPTITDCLVRMPSIEPRALNLFVKEGKEKQFEAEFARCFGSDFILMPKQEVLEKNLFGTGNEHPCLRSMLGDYLAVAVGRSAIYNTHREAERFIGVHAGLTEEELRIPLIVSDSSRK